MFKSLFPIFLAFITGWTVHLWYNNYTQKETPQPLEISYQQKRCREREQPTPQIIEKIITKEIIVPQIKTLYKTEKKKRDENATDMFLLYLGKNRFYQAMEYYDEGDETKHISYRSKLVGYFTKTYMQDRSKAIEEIEYFIDMESENKKFIFQLALFLEKNGEYYKAVTLMMELESQVDYEEQRRVHNQIKALSLRYIYKLYNAKNFEELIDFLHTQVNSGLLNTFYSFELAKAYIKLRKYLESKEILEVLKEEPIYKERAIKLLTYIQQKEEEKHEYHTEILMIKYGKHFLVKVYVNSLPLHLLLDTGASITTIDERKIKDLKVIKEHVRFATANGYSFSTIVEAKTFSVDSISLKNFKLSSYKSISQSYDGLLGMNFLGKFKFKIDQEEGILFLGKKEFKK